MEYSRWQSPTITTSRFLSCGVSTSADFDQAIALKPQYTEAYNHRGNAYTAKGDLGQAIALDSEYAKA